MVKFSGPGPAKSGCAAWLLAGSPTDAALTAPASGVHAATTLLLLARLCAKRCENGRITVCAQQWTSQFQETALLVACDLTATFTTLTCTD